MPSKYVLALGTTLEMSNEEVKDTTGNQAAASTPVTWVQLSDTTKSIEYTGESTDEVDVSTLGSEAFKEFALGSTDPGELSFTGHYVPKDKGQKAIEVAAGDKKLRLFRVTFPEGTKFEVVGLIKSKKWSVPNNGEVISRDVTVRLSGRPKVTVAG